MRRLRRILGILAAVLIVLVAATTLGTNAVLNSEAARARILAAIERATGHPARIDGPITVAWSFDPAFAIQNVAILNPPGFSRPELATARRIEARIALLPLLEGRIELPGLWINDPDIRLERNAAGIANWVAAPRANIEAAQSPSSSRPAMPVTIARLQIVNGTIAWQDAPPLQIHALQLTPGGPITASLTFKTTPFELAGSTKPPTQEGIPFEATAVGGGLAIAASGQAGGPKLQPIAFVAKTADLSALSPLLGRSLPRLQDVVLTGQLTASGPAGLTLTAGPSALDQILPGFALIGLKASLASMDQPAQIEATATLGTKPITAAASLKPSPSGIGVLLRGLRVTSPVGDLAGDLALILAPRPSLKGSLVSQHLDLDAWTMPPKPTQAAPQSTPTTTPAPPTQWLIPDRPLPFAALQVVDADLQWTIASLSTHSITYHSGSLRIFLQDGRLRIDPANIVAPGGASITAPAGPIQLTLQADASASPPNAALTLHAPTLDAAAVLATLGVPTAMTGGLDINLDLHASGATPHQMAATATGHAALALTDGEIENAVLAALFAPALRGADIPLDASGRSRVACLAFRLDATKGHATVKALALDTSKLRLDGDGTIDLGPEIMDLHLRPTIRLGPASVAVPVHVAGPWRAPKAAADRGIIAPGRFGIAIGAATPDPCGPALADVRAP